MNCQWDLLYFTGWVHIILLGHQRRVLESHYKTEMEPLRLRGHIQMYVDLEQSCVYLAHIYINIASVACARTHTATAPRHTTCGALREPSRRGLLHARNQIRRMTAPARDAHNIADVDGLDDSTWSKRRDHGRAETHDLNKFASSSSLCGGDVEFYVRHPHWNGVGLAYVLLCTLRYSFWMLVVGSWLWLNKYWQSTIVYVCVWVCVSTCGTRSSHACPLATV